MPTGCQHVSIVSPTMLYLGLVGLCAAFWQALNGTYDGMQAALQGLPEMLNGAEMSALEDWVPRSAFHVAACATARNHQVFLCTYLLQDQRQTRQDASARAPLLSYIYAHSCQIWIFYLRCTEAESDKGQAS